ncbi:MAG: ankyrin repeat domain-containing protein [Candidatus Zixiibacteriota bacterium]
MSELHDAVKDGDLERVKLLLDTGTDVNQLDEDGGAALHIACSSGQTDIVRELLKRGADAGIDSDEWEPPLSIAVSNGYVEIAKLLAKHIKMIPDEYGQMLIGFAAASGDLKTLKYAVKAFGPIAYDKTSPRYTPLHWAAQENHPEIIEYLLTLGLDANSIDDVGRTPLFSCLSKEAVDAMRVLLANGANPNFRAGEAKDTCLQLAAAFNQCAIAELLLDNGADVDIVDDKERTPLMTALNHENIDMIKLFLARGADVMLKNYKGKSAKDLAKTKTKAIRELF